MCVIGVVIGVVHVRFTHGLHVCDVLTQTMKKMHQKVSSVQGIHHFSIWIHRVVLA